MDIVFSDDFDISAENFHQLISKTVSATLELENFSDNVEISYTFVGNDEIKEINRKFRNKDNATDVLSFPLLSKTEIETANKNQSKNELIYLGDIVLSLEMAKKQSVQFGHSIEREVAFLTAHSVLHLLGYDHETESEEKEMFAKQNAVMENIGVSRDNTP